MRIYYFLLLISLLFYSWKALALPPESSHDLATKDLISGHEWQGINFSGYIDTSYNYLLRKNVFISDVDDRLYDIEPNGFTLQQATFFIARQPEQGFGALVNPLIGRDANKTAFYGWDTIRDTSRPKTIELGVGYVPHPAFDMSAQIYSGGERLIIRTATGPIGRRNFIDVIAALHMTDKLTIAGNYDYGMQTKAALPFNQIGTAKWQGIAGYLYYRFSDQYRATLRAEIFSDTDGYMTGVNQSWQEATLTLAYKPIPSLVLKAETRHDFSNVNPFVSTSGRRPRNNQQSYALEGLYLL